MSHRDSKRTSSYQQNRKRQWFLKRLWHAVMGESVGVGLHTRRFGMLESLEERRVLATLYATSQNNDLLTFDSATPGTIATSISITGLDANTIVRGIDFRPATGQLYALGIVDDGPTQTGRLYQLNTANAVATPVGPAFSTTLNDADNWEIDFNPTVDRIRVVNDLDDNLRLNPNDGSLVASDTSLTVTREVRGVAYDRNEGASLTTLYAYEFSSDRLATIGGIDGIPSPNAGVVTTLPAPSGILAFGPNPFDIGSGSTSGFMAANLAGTSLVSLNLSTGAATNLGLIGNGAVSITGLAIPLQSLTVVGTAGADTLVVNATGANSGSYSLNGGPAVPFSNLNSFSFIAAGGSDTLTINNPAGGLFAPSGGIDYNGGGQAGDTLQLLGGVGGAQTYFVGTTNPPIGAGPGNNTDGLIRFTGATPVDIRFTGLAPIIDTVLASSLTVVSTDAANNISVTNGSASRLLVNVDAFESIEFTNKSQFIINAGDGVAGGDAADNVLLNFSNLPSALTSMTINADGGADVVNVQATSGVPVAINGGDGLDIINVGNTGSLGTPGLLTPVAGPVSVNGGVDGANLTVDGSGAAVAADYTITSTSVTRSLPIGFGGVTYSNLSSLLLTVGAGANVITVMSTAVGVPTTVNTNAGIDTVNVLSTSVTGPLSIDTGSELDTINIGNSGAVGAPGLLTPVAGAVNVNGGTGGANLVVDGSGAAVAADYAITSTTVTRSIPAGFGGVFYSSLNSLLLTVGAGANVISVNGTAASVPTSIATGAGDDTIVLANGVSLNGGTVDGGADIDTIDYSAYTTNVSVNLGSNAPAGALAGVIDGGQENPGQVTTATGTVTISNYNTVTRTFDISASVSNLLPSAVTGFHIHRAPVGVNGPIILDLAAIFGLGSLIADGWVGSTSMPPA